MELNTVGTCIIVGTMLFAMFAIVCRWASMGGILAFCLLGIVAGAVVPNFSRIGSLIIKWGEYLSVDLQMMKEVRQTAEQVGTTAQQVESDRDEIRQMKEQIEALVERAQESEERISQMHSALVTVQQRTASRCLSDEQKEFLMKAASPFPGQRVSVGYLLGGDGSCLAEDILLVLRKAGWDFEGRDTTAQVIYPRPVSGVEVEVREEDLDARRFPKAAYNLVVALAQSKVNSGGVLYADPKLPSGKISIVVGQRQEMEKVKDPS